jgi:hypothetical protein
LDRALLNELSSKSQGKINLPAKYSGGLRGMLYLPMVLMVIGRGLTADIFTCVGCEEKQ